MSNEPAVKKDKGEGGGGREGRGGGGGGGGGIREYLLLIFLFIFAVFAGLSKKEREEMIKIAKLGRKIRRGEVSAEDEFISVFENILAGGEEEGKGEGEGEGEGVQMHAPSLTCAILRAFARRSLLPGGGGKREPPCSRLLMRICV